MEHHHDNPSESGVTCPQELVDLILGETDSADLRSCALVARSFRPTSQKLIFSDLTILPPGRDNIPALQRLADVLSTSPHLALHVRTLHLLQPGSYERCVWMMSDILPTILSVLNNLENLNIRIYNWDSHFLHSNNEQALFALIARSSLSSFKLEQPRLDSNTRFFSLLRCLPASLKSVTFLHGFGEYNDDDASTASPKLHPTSLHLDIHIPALFHWAIRDVDLECIRHLYTMADRDTIYAVQQLLEGAICVEACYITFDSILSLEKKLNLEKMQALRTLEISVELDWDEIEELGFRGEGRHSPLHDAMSALDTAPPHSVEHFVLNLNIWDPGMLSRFMKPVSPRLRDFGEDRPALQDVTVRIISEYEDPKALQRGIQYLQTVFSSLHTRGMLTAIVVCPPSED